ncbi:MAG: alpha-N-arabinofuranosidase [Clostridia bacterium]|nr:alpha-N-arabinofuranosidase [Clostridia bacterium]
MAKIDIHKNYRIGKIEKTLFGTFVEHMGRSIYGGIYDPQSKYSDEKGFRKDVVALVKELGVGVIRYPGGNFLSGYDWKDAIGPKEERKARLDLAWFQTEPNTIGIHEFSEWAKEAGVEIMLGVNMGTGTPREAGEYVEYCNHPSGTYWSDKRAENGAKEPFSIEYWCVGNEMDGDWQICTKKAEEYGRIAHETAKIMKWVDPSLKLTVCGSSGSAMPTYPEWDRIVLEHTYNDIEYLSLHKYYEFPNWDKTRVSDFLASFVDFDAFIKTGKATIEYVKTYRRSKKQVYISVDEWNVWHTNQGDCQTDKWSVGARRLENRYTALDAVVFSSLMLTLINNADCVKVACLAQLVNVIAPIFVEQDKEAIKQTIFYPFSLGSKYAKGEAMRTLVDSEEYSSVWGSAPYLYSATAYDDETGELSVFLVNNREEKSEVTEMDFHGFGNLEAVETLVLDYKDKFDINDFDARENVKMVQGEKAKETANGSFSFTMPKLSFAVLRFKEKKQ